MANRVDYALSAGGSSIKVSGIADLIEALQIVGGSVDDLGELMGDVGEVVASDARLRSPYLTGRLRNSIVTTHGRSKAVVWAGGPDVPYAGVIHFGWPERNIRAQPFLTDALRSQSDRAVGTLEEGIRLILKQHSK